MSNDRLSVLAKRATANATRDGKIEFGQPVSVPQMTDIERYVKKHCRSGILRFLACTEKQLRQYSRNEIRLTELPDKTRARLRELSRKNDSFYSKPWPRKSATSLYVLHLDRKRKSASKPKTQPSEPASA